MANTATHTFVVQRFADPFLRCVVCGEPVEGYIVAPGHDEDWHNYPCQHLGVTSICPSWGPVDGCRCLEHLGYVNHPNPDRN